MKRIVLLHGAPGDGTLWRPVAEALAGRARLVTPTLRWFGPDPWPDDGRDFGTEAHTDDLLRVLAAEQAGGPPAVAAWSYSTHVVLNAMRRRSDLFGRVLLYEPGLDTYLDGAARDDFLADAYRVFGPVFEALQRQGPEAALAALFDATGSPGLFASLPPDRRERYRASARMLPLLFGGGRPPAPITAADLATITVPTTVACGARTQRLFRIASEAVAAGLGAGRLKIVDGADHMLPEADPAAFAALLAAML